MFSTLPTALGNRGRDSHSSTASTTATGRLKTASLKNQQLRVGQNKLPKWARFTCQTELGKPERRRSRDQAAKAAVYANRWRIQGAHGKRLQRQRGERVERNFAHQFDTSRLDRLYVRGIKNVHKKFLIQAAPCNLALPMRSMYGSGKPKAACDPALAAIFAILAFIRAVEDCFLPWWADPQSNLNLCRILHRGRILKPTWKIAGFRRAVRIEHTLD